MLQIMFGVIIAVMLKLSSTGNDNFAKLCPTVLNVFNFLLFLLSCASFLNISAIAVDRLLAISLHLRYQELVTSKRVIFALITLWLTCIVYATICILHPKGSSMVAVVMGFAGMISTTMAYIRIYQVVRYHQYQIQCCQLQLQNAQAVQEQLRQKKSAYNVLFVYVVFLACYLPTCISVILFITDSTRISFKVASEASVFLVLLNSSLNPLVYCWRYQEIREIVKSTVRKIFRVNYGELDITSRIKRQPKAVELDVVACR